MSSGPFRLKAGGQIDRTREIAFEFDHCAYHGFAGDTVASALLAGGVSVVGRSFKFHRPRGVLTAGLAEPNALLTVGTGGRRTPSVRATTEPLVTGLQCFSQNCWPSLTWDCGRINDFAHRLLPAGFYNKTFMWPSWHFYEPAIRRMAGLGIPSDEPDPDRYEWRNAHCDVLIVGAGCAGLLASALAGHAGARVILLETDRVIGGEWNHSRADGDTAPLARAAHASAELARLPNVRQLLRTTAVGVYDHGMVTAVETAEPSEGRAGEPAECRQRWWRIRAQKIIIATGALEQPLAFPFNDRPGIMLAGAMRAYVNRYAVAAGRRVVIATNNDSAYQAARDMQEAGVQCLCLLDTRAALSATLVAAMSAAGIPVHAGARIIGTRGDRRVSSVDYTVPGSARAQRVRCDALAMSGGFNPTTHLFSQAGGQVRFDDRLNCLVPITAVTDMSIFGSAAALFHPKEAVEHLHAELSPASPIPEWALPIPDEMAGDATSTGALGYPHPGRRDRVWIDFQHDVTAADIDLSVSENLVSVEHVKRYTTLGMAVDQGKTSNLNGLAILAQLTDRPTADVGTTRFRPPFVPVTLGAIAGGRRGRFFRPTRLMPAHQAHVERGAHFEDFGPWRRPAYYPKAAETFAACISREVDRVRNGAGLFEASPLGKILVRGPDAAEFLDIMYANTQRTLRAGYVRYGIMLNEQGVIIDDGVCACLSPDEFLVNTSTGGTARIMAAFDQYLQCDRPDFRVLITDVTNCFATLTLTGPRARDVLAELPFDIDFSATAFPHMRVRSGSLYGMPCRVARVSFSGELSFEISIQADFGVELWTRLLSAGERFGLEPYGIEALNVLRIEKGYIHVGAETDGTTVPADIGFAAALQKKSGDFVGRRSLRLTENTRPDRLQLVGLRCIGSSDAFVAGAHFVDQAFEAPPVLTAGYLTSACYSPSLGTHLGLGMLKSGFTRKGEIVRVVNGKSMTTAEVVAPCHYDVNGARLRD